MAAVVTPIVSTFVPKGVIDAEKAFAKLGKQLQSAIGTAAFLAFGKAAIGAAEDAQKSAARIENIAKQMGMADGEIAKVTDRLLDYASATARATGIDDDQIAAIQAKLLTFRSLATTAGNLGDVFDRTTKAALDLAAAGFGDAESNATLLAKALENPAKGLTKLERAIGPLNDAQRNNIQNLIKQNDLYGAQQAILSAVESRVGGTAESTATATDKLAVTFDQLAETVGQAILPTFEQLVTLFGKAVDLFTAAPKELQSFIIVGLGLVVVLKKIRTALVAMKVEASSANVVIAGLAAATELYFALFGDNEDTKSEIAAMASEMAGMTDETLLAQDAAKQLIASIEGVSRRDYFKTLVKSSPEVARRLLDLYQRTGQSKEMINDLALEIYNYDQAAGNAAKTTSEYGSANSDATTKTRSFRDTLKSVVNRLQEQAQAYQDALDAKLEFFSADLAASRSQRDVLRSLKDYQDLMAEITAGTYDGENAMLDAADAQDAFYEATLESAAAQAALAQAQGSTTSATDIQIAELQRVRDQLAPDDPLRKRLDEYITQLENIPEELKTDLEANVKISLTALYSNIEDFFKRGPDRAGGGPVSNGMTYLVGENGPELFSPPGGGSIIPTSRLASLGASSTTGSVYNITVNGAIDPAGTARTIKTLLQDDGKRRNQVPVPT